MVIIIKDLDIGAINIRRRGIIDIKYIRFLVK